VIHAAFRQHPSSKPAMKRGSSAGRSFIQATAEYAPDFASRRRLFVDGELTWGTGEIMYQTQPVRGKPGSGIGYA